MVTSWRTLRINALARSLRNAGSRTARLAPRQQRDHAVCMVGIAFKSGMFERRLSSGQ